MKMKSSVQYIIPILFGTIVTLCSASAEDEKPTSTDADTTTIRLEDIGILVLSQSNVHHARRADLFRRKLNLKVKSSGQNPPLVHMLHEKYARLGAWTIKPILSDIVKDFKEKKVVLFCEEETDIEISKLLEALQKYDFNKDLFMGHALRDKEPTIIHHFAFHENPSSFAYPDFAAGFLLSLSLLQKLSDRMKKSSKETNFAIDAKHELALFIYDDGKGIRMKDVPFLCTEGIGDLCATTNLHKFPVNCGNPVLDDDIFFAIKTCSKFHKDRIPIVKSTWGKDAKNIEYYSDLEDETIPTINLGIPNTERGHCGKTMAIIRRAYEEEHISSRNWLVIADDDSLISVPRMRRLLACYPAAEPIALGERYGYGVNKESGYDYITGGGSMVLSHMAVLILMDSGTCDCSSDDAPDDMTLGLCLKRLGIAITHSPLFHQARPMDYAAEYLAHQLPVSFHKHWNADPIAVYENYLQDFIVDNNVNLENNSTQFIKEEL